MPTRTRCSGKRDFLNSGGHDFRLTSVNFGFSGRECHSLFPASPKAAPSLHLRHAEKMAITAERRRTGGAAGPARGRDAALMGVGGLGPRALSHQHGGEL